MPEEQIPEVGVNNTEVAWAANIIGGLPIKNFMATMVPSKLLKNYLLRGAGIAEYVGKVNVAIMKRWNMV